MGIPTRISSEVEHPPCAGYYAHVPTSEAFVILLRMLRWVDRGVIDFERTESEGATTNKGSGRGCDMVAPRTAVTEVIPSKTVSSITFGRDVESTSVLDG